MMTRIAAAATAVLVPIGVAGSAHAASHQAASHVSGTAAAKPVLVKRVTVAMEVTGVDAAVAKAHGYKVVTLADGRQEAVAASKAVSPNDTIEGDCGDAYLNYYAVGNKEAYVDSGFSLNQPAVYYYWDVAVKDSAGTGTKLFYGTLADDYTWADEWLTTHSVTGSSTATVTDGWVLLYNGNYCTALDPSSTTTLY